MTLREVYQRMSDRELRLLRDALRLDRAARRCDRRLQAFAAYRLRVIAEVLRERCRL